MNKLKVVILCGGLGTRLAEETKIKPKPMVNIGNKPIIWHILKIYKYYGFSEFILALGYKGEALKKYFANSKENWNVRLVNTGLKTLTGGRLLRLRKMFSKNETFLVTYGDGVSNINIKKLVQFHKSHGKIATVTAVRPPVRFGELNVKKNIVKRFEEKPQAKLGWINGGFFVFSEEVFNYINNDQTIFEREPLERLAKEKNLMAFKHTDYWQCMDTLRDKKLLNKIWKSNKAPWKKW